MTTITPFQTLLQQELYRLHTLQVAPLATVPYTYQYIQKRIMQKYRKQQSYLSLVRHMLSL